MVMKNNPAKLRFPALFQSDRAQKLEAEDLRLFLEPGRSTFFSLIRSSSEKKKFGPLFAVVKKNKSSHLLFCYSPYVVINTPSSRLLLIWGTVSYSPQT